MTPRILETYREIKRAISDAPDARRPDYADASLIHEWDSKRRSVVAAILTIAAVLEAKRDG